MFSELRSLYVYIFIFVYIFSNSFDKTQIKVYKKENNGLN